MGNIAQKKDQVLAWLNSAGEAEIDALLETITLPDKQTYDGSIIQELNARWDDYMSGKEPDITLEAFREKFLSKG